MPEFTIIPLKMNIITRNIPNAITCMNVACGTIAVIMAFADTGFAGLHPWQWAWIFIGLAAVADFFDGFAARALHAYSEMGKELDSLCDLVSFGVAPAMVLYNCLTSLSPLGASCWVSWLCILIPVAGALRLARFNIDTRQTTSFIGLPIPANAIFWIGYTALAYSGASFLLSPFVAAAFIIVVAWLLNSPLRIFSLKFKTWGWSGNEARWLLIISAPVFLFLCGVPGLFWLIVFYLLLSLLPFSRK